MERLESVNSLWPGRLIRSLVLVIAGTLPLLRADTVTLRDGTTLVGVIVMQNDEELGLKQDKMVRFIPMNRIESIKRSGAAAARSGRALETGVARPATPTERAPGSLADPIANSTVKVFATVSLPDVRKPWTRLDPHEERGSGFVVSGLGNDRKPAPEITYAHETDSFAALRGRLILTNAHVVAYATNVQVRANQSDQRLPARVVAIDTALDLAILKLDDERFFDAHPALAVLPLGVKTGVMVQVFGYPDETANVRVLDKEIVSADRAPFDSRVSGLMIGLSSELPPGASGGPVTYGQGHVLGIACCRPPFNGGNAYVVTCGEIWGFLDRISKGRLPGTRRIYDHLQGLGNPALRAFLGIDPAYHGMAVTSSTNRDDRALLEWDLLFEIGSRRIDDEGTVTDVDRRIDFVSSVDWLGDDFPVNGSVIRGGRVVRLDLRGTFHLPSERPALIPGLDGAAPSYFIFGPIAFSAASSELLSLITGSARMEALLTLRGSPLVTRSAALLAFPGEQLVVVPAPFFPHKLVRGYSDPSFTVVKAVNGIPIRNLAHLVQVLRDAKDEFVTFEFFEKYSEILVFSRTEMIAATEGVLNDNNVRSQGSPDMMAVWNAK